MNPAPTAAVHPGFDALLVRLVGLVFLHDAPPLPKLADGAEHAERIRGEWVQRQMTRINALHEAYLAVAREEVAAAKAKEPPKPSPAQPHGGKRP